MDIKDTLKPRSPVNGLVLATLYLGLLFLPSLGIGAPGQSFEDAAKHWAYQPIQHPRPPEVTARGRIQSPIDAFLLAKLEQHRLSFAPPADPRTLLRRTYYDLIGLPPTLEEIRAFEQDRSSNAFAKVVDRLLASPRYGERWGRHWLDVARYADTKDLVLAYGKDALRPYAYTYRNYVIQAFNEDLPYNQFIEDQLSADLAGPNLPRWRLAALGFLTLGRLFDNNPHDQIDDQIDTTTRGFLGLTVACARCHDHKYDAITQKDYYGLYGVFASTARPYDLPLLEDPKQVPDGLEFENQLGAARKELEKHIDSEFVRLSENFRQRFGDYLFRAATTEPDITETTQFALSLTPDDFRPTLMLRTRRWLRQHLTSEDPVFGPWAQLMELEDEKFQENAARATAQNFTPPSTATVPAPHFNALVVSVLQQATLTNKTAVARVYAQLFREVYEESKKPAAGSPNGGLSNEQRELFRMIVGSDSPITFPPRDTPDFMSRPEKDRYNSLESNLDKVAANATNTPPARAMVLADLPEPYDAHVFKRGNPSRPGDPAPRGFLQVLTPGHPLLFTNGSGRLELARAIANPTNPLTARVFVNRVWMLHFGESLVGSTTDFGVRSDPPTHPELLDWLASEFIRSGWSIKHLHRLMLLTTAYQQSASNSAPSGSQLDPENKWLSHYPRRRLDFEAMRDTVLFASGQLDLKPGGRPFDLAVEPTNPRRAIYALINRQDLPATFRAFDFPIPDQCLERRPRTSVPQQALFALNSPLVLEEARALASRPEVTAAVEPAQRIEVLFGRTLGRLPSETETDSALRFIRAAELEGPTDHGLSAWEQFAQVLLISNEAVFLD
jgi:hypothetical protein